MSANETKIHKLDILYEVNDPYTVVSVDRKTDGFPLLCSIHTSAKWCPERKKVVEENLDAANLWLTGIPTVIRVPIMPTENIEPIVHIEPTDEPDLAEVRWSPYPDDRSVDEDYEFVGFISPGAGRGLIRTLMFNYLEAKLATIDKCSARSHNAAAERLWQRNLHGAKSRFIGKYSVMTEGMCVYCFQSRTRSVSDEDLVPESSGSEVRSIWADAERTRAIKEAKREADLLKIRKMTSHGTYKDFTPKFAPASKDDKTDKIF